MMAKWSVFVFRDYKTCRGSSSSNQSGLCLCSETIKCAVVAQVVIKPS